MVVNTYRGLLTDTSPGNQNRIRLQTIKGKVGYRIVKFQVMTDAPVGAATEHVVKIYKSEQTTVDAIVNFTDSDLLGVNVWTNAVGYGFEGTMGIIFDREIFNQDIYLTQFEATGASACNYYLELEVIPLDDAGAEYTTLKDMRQ